MKIDRIEALSLATDVLDLVDLQLGKWSELHALPGTHTGQVTKSHSDVKKVRNLIADVRREMRKEEREHEKANEAGDG